MLDLRPRTQLYRIRRRVSHWTPRYLYHRTRAGIDRLRHPTAPSLTPGSIRLLAQLLRPQDRGIEWGSGNSTPWFAERTAHLTSYETNDKYYAIVQNRLAAQGLANVDYQCVPFADSEDEEVMHESTWVRAASGLVDESLDYALVDSSPRGCLCFAVADKLRFGGVLVLDNANWYLPPPDDVYPRAPDSAKVAMGMPGSRAPQSMCWRRFVEMSSDWRKIWTSDGVQMTLLMIKAQSTSVGTALPELSCRA